MPWNRRLGFHAEGSVLIDVPTFYFQLFVRRPVWKVELQLWSWGGGLGPGLIEWCLQLLSLWTADGSGTLVSLTSNPALPPSPQDPSLPSVDEIKKVKQKELCCHGCHVLVPWILQISSGCWWDEMDCRGELGVIWVNIVSLLLSQTTRPVVRITKVIFNLPRIRCKCPPPPL